MKRDRVSWERLQRAGERMHPLSAVEGCKLKSCLEVLSGFFRLAGMTR